MSASTKLSTAVQALCFLANKPGEACSSEEISEATGIHASRIRHILAMLVRDGIVRASRGLHGGFQLIESPERIDLQRIYCAVETRKAFHLDVSRTGGSSQSLSFTVNAWFLRLFADLQVTIEDRMRDITLHDIMNGIHVPLSTSTEPS